MSMLQKLKEHLSSITPEQFRKEWEEIEAKGFQGPSVEEFIKNQDRRITIEEDKLSNESKIEIDNLFKLGFIYITIAYPIDYETYMQGYSMRTEDFIKNNYRCD